MIHLEVPQGSTASETGSKHYPQARARWHSRPQSIICKYPPSPPFLTCKDLNKVEFLSSQIRLFAIPLRCELHSPVCEGLRFIKVVGDLNRFFMRFY